MLTTKQIEKISKAMGDTNRLKILYYLSEKGGCGECAGLSNVIDLAQPSISHHVKILVDAGLIEDRKDGRNHTYTINSPQLSAYISALEELKA